MTSGLWPACKGLARQAALRQHLATDMKHNSTVGRYPDTVNLPFNFSSISDGFSFEVPSGISDPADTCWVLIQGSNLILCESEEGPVLPRGHLPDWLARGLKTQSVGTWQGLVLAAGTVSRSVPLNAPFIANDFNASSNLIDIATLSLAGLAKQIMHWQHQSRHCSCCGAATEQLGSGWGKRCVSCGREHFPHIHPCAIVLVKRDQKLLLARKAEWAAGRYGLVAGFLDFGESLEECAIREVREETGIEVRNVRYVGSQNWPFPSQLMAGFVAEYDSGEIRVDQNELEDARWFKRSELPLLPGQRSIARWIIDNFK